MELTDELILLIERAGKQSETFAAALEKKGFNIEVVPTGQQALRQAAERKPALIILNAASLGSNGLRICQRLRDAYTELPLIHILSIDEKNNVRVSPAEVSLYLPFTPRKLVNRIVRLLPGQRKDTVEVGAVRFSPNVRIVEAYGREKRLTPRTAALLAVFLEHPGETIARRKLMREVWDTDYIGDTRTLDVHVRWVREAVEKNPASPRHIVTIRRVGYRFDPHPDQRSDDNKK